MRRPTARFTTALALVAASLAWAAPASAAVDGFDVTIRDQPGTITVGDNARTLTAVVTTDRERRCRKVRWALTIRAEGIALDQIRVNRVENGGTFRVRQQVVGGDTARLIDAEPDPGELCRDRTVTGRWDIAVEGTESGTVTFAASALEGADRELATASTTSRVVSTVAATPSPTESEEVVDDQPGDAAGAGDTPAGKQTSAAALDPTGGTPSLLGPGLIIGAVLVFLGVALLMRLRTRTRRETAPAWQTQTRMLPNGFYGDAPPRRR